MRIFQDTADRNQMKQSMIRIYLDSHNAMKRLCECEQSLQDTMIHCSCFGTRLSLYTHPHLAVFYFHSLGPVSPLRSPWVPVCPWRHGSRSPPLTGQRWTSQGWHSPPAGWHTPTPANEQTQPTDTSELFLKIFFFCQIVRLLSSYFIFSKPLWLFLTQSRRGLWGAGHLVAAKRWGLQEAPLWPRSRSPCATCPCLAGTRLINIH